VRAARVLTENAALDGKAFDYLVPDSMTVAVGDRVRVNLAGRSLRGWILEEGDVTRATKPLVKWLGYGPSPEAIDVARWVAERWYGPLSRVLTSMSPATIVRDLPERPPVGESTQSATGRLEPGLSIYGPSEDPFDLILELASRPRRGTFLILAPSEGYAERLNTRLRRQGVEVAGPGQWAQQRADWPVVVGARGAALSPLSRLGAALVLDAEDESYRSESQPTWWAPAVVAERARRDGAPWWMTSSAPTADLFAFGEPHWRDTTRWWPRVRVVDRREGDPHDGVLDRTALAAVTRALEGPEEVAAVIVLQRLGSGRLFACRSCRELCRCAVCAQAEIRVGGELTCGEGHERRAAYCRACGSSAVVAVRSGVTTLARDVAALTGQSVSELTGNSRPGPLERVVVGTEAALHRVRRAGVVVFADFDQYLLAPREGARSRALGVVARAGRLVGPRTRGGEVVVQTRRHDEVIDALVKGEPRPVIEAERDEAEALLLTPYGAPTEIRGEGASEWTRSLEISGMRRREIEGGVVLRHGDPARIPAALGALRRPEGPVRVRVW
jgi:primosomal protein N' (replication factor Y)